MADAYPNAAGVAEGLTPFARRNSGHETAREFVTARLKSFGFEVLDHGAEFADGLSELVQKQDDRCSLMIRYRPDMIGILPGVVAVLCEVKGPPPKRVPPDSICIEARAYRGLVEWNVGGRVAMLVYVHTTTTGKQFAGASWLSNVPPPSTVFVPRRSDHAMQRTSMAGMFPSATLVDTAYKPGPGMSGTPFIRVPMGCFCALDTFVRRELLPDVPA